MQCLLFAGLLHLNWVSLFVPFYLDIQLIVYSLQSKVHRLQNVDTKATYPGLAAINPDEMAVLSRFFSSTLLGQK